MMYNIACSKNEMYIYSHGQLSKTYQQRGKEIKVQKHIYEKMFIPNIPLFI